MSSKDRNLVLIGDSLTAEVFYEYFMHDSAYTVVGFAVEKEYLEKDQFLGLPVVALEDLESHFPPANHDVFVSVVYTQLNRLRTRLAKLAKSKGYKLASYVSSNAQVWANVEIGEHCFIFENNTVQPFVSIGDNVILWSGNHIGHHSEIGNNVFVASHAVISGSCKIGDNCFIGVNVTLADGVEVARDCWIGPNVLLTKDTAENTIYRTKASEPAKISARRFLKVPD
jgi:sugar O-acyltransferase (sialic acid O-acetyltransferase NeuD family)